MRRWPPSGDRLRQFRKVRQEAKRARDRYAKYFRFCARQAGAWPATDSRSLDVEGALGQVERAHLNFS